LVNINKRLSEENLAIGVEIERLKYDPAYIENIARQELGMIRADEFILKPKK
jgi:cell division protein FtsB